MVPSIAYFMANRVLENWTWRTKLESMKNQNLENKKIMDKAKGYVIDICQILSIKLTEEEIRESAAEIMIQIRDKEI